MQVAWLAHWLIQPPRCSNIKILWGPSIAGVDTVSAHQSRIEEEPMAPSVFHASPEQPATVLPDLTLYASLELSRSTWLVTCLLPDRDKMSKYSTPGGDGGALLGLLERMRARALLQTLRRSGGMRFGREGRAVSDFKGRHFEGEIVLWAVRWYCRYGVSYRDLEQMMGERGVSVDHSTIFRWVQKYAPEIEKRLRWQWRRPRSTSWRIDETYVKVRGRWAYLYRAVDKFGNTIDFYLSPTRNTKAAKRFLSKTLNGLKDWDKPRVINTDKAPTYAAALAELKKEGKCPKDTQHRQVKYLNNVVEADHGKLKQLIRPVRGFKSMKTAYATIKGFEVMHALRKGQAAIFNLTRDIVGEARLVERAFGLGPCALTEAVQLLGERLEAA